MVPKFDDLLDLPDPPLLEELGVDLGAICRRVRATLLGGGPFDDADMGGAALIAAALAFLHLASGRLHFGVVLGWTAASAAALWFIAHQLPGAGVDLYACSVCLGYGLAPMVVANVVACGVLAAGLVVRRAPELREQRSLLAYPAPLYYAAIALLSLGP